MVSKGLNTVCVHVYKELIATNTILELKGLNTVSSCSGLAITHTILEVKGLNTVCVCRGLIATRTILELKGLTSLVV